MAILERVSFMRILLAVSLISITVLGIATSAIAGDWPQFRGPNRDGHATSEGLLKSWPAQGPKRLWTADALGEGWSSAAVVNGQVYITGMRSRKEHLIALDAQGKQRWRTEYGSAWRKSFPGARSTPTVVGRRAYVISGAGEVACLELETGRLVWQIPALKKFQGRTGEWGTAECPLVHGNRVFYTACGDSTTVVALHKDTGETLWASPSIQDKSAFVSPILVNHSGRDMLVTVTGAYVIGVDIAQGDILWKYPYASFNPAGQQERRLHINAVSPIYHGGRIFVSSGYDHFGVMLEISPESKQVSELWRNETLDCHHGGVLVVDEHIYGASWESNSSGHWMCLDWNTGKALYETSWNDNKGPIVYADGMLYCCDEDDALVGLAKASPLGFDVISSFEITVGKGKLWAHPSIADGKLYIRHGEFLQAFAIR